MIFYVFISKMLLCQLMIKLNYFIVIIKAKFKICVKNNLIIFYVSKQLFKIIKRN